ncbi:MAG: hypothetical protein OXR73_22060 [Myxococcales bacterium]|nr:hypothetical protein [Myxococcales bacterium]
MPPPSASWDLRPPGLLLALGLALAALSSCPTGNPSDSRGDTERAGPEQLTTALVNAWAEDDRVTLELLATPGLTTRLSQDPAWRWPSVTPATVGARLQLHGAETVAPGRIVLAGTVQWGMARRGVRVSLVDHIAGYRAVVLEWDSGPAP